nr:hypothetical protein [uncultured Mediterranean phage uvMED]
MLYRLKKDIEPKHNIVFFDSEIEEVVEGVYVDEGVIGEVVDQGKTNNKRHLAFWFDKDKSINFLGWKHLEEYLEAIDLETADALMSEATRH